MNTNALHVKILIIIILPIILISESCKRDLIPDYLCLDVKAGDPLYTTYAASMGNSEFIIDQGYEFIYDDNNNDIKFSSAAGGGIGFGFVDNGRWIAEPLDMESMPEIFASFPDMVRFGFEPVKDIICNGTFVVSSSSSAIIDLQISNMSDINKDITLVPYIENNNRFFTNIEGDSTSFVFTSEKYTDNWTLSHNLPHQDTLLNIFTVSSTDVEKNASNVRIGNNPSLPYSINPEKNRTNMFISGRIFNKEGSRVNGNQQKIRISVFNHDRSELITESCPLPGSTENPLNDGFFRINVGNFTSHPASTRLTICSYIEDSAYSSSYDTTITSINPSASFRKDITVNKRMMVPQVQDINVTVTSEGAELSWSDSFEGYKYDIYKREERENSYRRIAMGIEIQTYTDSDYRQDNISRYLIIPFDKKTGLYGPVSREATTLEPVSFMKFAMGGNLEDSSENLASILSFRENIHLKPGETKKVRIVRYTSNPDCDSEILKKQAGELIGKDLTDYLRYNLKSLREIKSLLTNDRNTNLLLLSSFNMMRQVMYPPEGSSSYNYYVFSREPVWGWGHGGQVFHESIAMLAYGLLFPESAMDSQRVFSERQYENGYINYRTGPYLDEIIEFNNELTSSAPWYSWLNWEIYKMTGDRDFLEEMYQSGKKFYNFFISSRDKDNDGLCEWGGHAVLESVRDALVAVWDEVGWPSEFEGVDINCMLVKEAKSLENMAIELDLRDEADSWKKDYSRRSDLINEICWDNQDGFYYNADRKDNDFSYMDVNDLKRQEIIGFLPLWAGVASDEQAKIIIEKLTDPDKFWRPNGIPSLSASDSYYNDKGYWNGPVWVEWNYLVMRGLLDYGYDEEARKLVERVSEIMIQRLSEDHNLWEFYSPDDNWGGYHKTYIWSGIINRMLYESGIINVNNITSKK